jgi:protein required for attachment to host cells
MVKPRFTLPCKEPFMAKTRRRLAALDPQPTRAAQLVLVADRATARLLRATGGKLARTLVELAELTDPAARLPNRELVTDRTGRVFDSGSRTGVGPATRTRHGAQSDYDPHAVTAERFARRVARRLDAERRKQLYGGLTIIAGRQFLGVLRPLLSKPTQAWVRQELGKDLVHATDAQILRSVLP